MSVVAKSYHKDADPVVAYCSEHTVVQAPLQVELQNETLANAPHAGMLGAPEVLTFGQNFIKMFGGKRALDVGTFTGASALAWALAVPDDGEVYTFDIDHTNYHKFGVPILSKCEKTFKKIKPVEGPGVESLDKLIADGQSGTFDFAFIDAEKTSYPAYYEKCVTLLRPGGVIFVDNSLRGGSVADEKRREDPNCRAIHEMNDKIYQDDRTYSALLNLGDGTHVAFKK
ncbi:O-methyltransferase [Caenorhabditis elegans]|uniref:O-methyltransferase n=1 Tax=Caenorhabditis elegans TaxID=6239 RepID=Q8WTM3_CAEEL|nr:O-methyltransferase [Caenorhabditis elegans]CCD70635.1 O-methyltransferase [Caenorhabditis elegans]|eukprot:NP_503559.2 Catechol-O-MethylTransferase family [Caenorhabditis elegans]